MRFKDFLQMFAEPADNRTEPLDGQSEGAATKDDKAGDSEPVRKYTDDDVDRIVKKRLGAERKKMARLLDEEQATSEIEIREKNVLVRELTADAKEMLINDGLPASLSGLLDYTDKETLENSYKDVKAIFENAVIQGVSNKVRTPVPIKGYGGNADTAIAEVFKPPAR